MISVQSIIGLKPDPRQSMSMRLQAFGDLLCRSQRGIAIAQWVMVVLYLFLLIAPALSPLPERTANVFGSLAGFAEALFWGIWWPSVLLVTMLFGQFWCGLLCPDGTLTEFASQHGRGLKIPAWMRRPVLPLILFSVIGLYEHLIDATRVTQATLLVIGSTSLAAVLTGALFGKGKRVWCRYVCPGGSVFSLLARCAVLHFRVDRARWDAAPSPAPKPVDCPPLLDVRRLASNEKCNMCGRCSGHRNAVALALRYPGEEIASMSIEDVRLWEAAGILFVLIGLLYAALHWNGNVWHTAVIEWARQLIAPGPGWAKPAPWWLFARADGGAVDRFSALGTAVLIPLTALALGGILAAFLLLGCRQVRHAAALCYSLIPLGGIGLILGALEHAFELFAGEGADSATLLTYVRLLALCPATLWSLALAFCQLEIVSPKRFYRKAQAYGAFCLAVTVLVVTYFQAPIPASFDPQNERKHGITDYKRLHQL